ncbi:hypothetical protein RD792_012042 [Penstemon davidsonii]|uniref:Glycoside hydrolase family 13 N-terminal domain-containing protein n=1 Tax=Penstemon davidsonii TaxID=160366 RepID=A0ABR0CXB9_9LAMI|nr:hypothetical protein RD792_012042 [Penstemon davidsonii]
MVYTLSGVRLPTVPSVYKIGSHGSSSHADRRSSHLTFLLKNRSHPRKIFSGKTFESGFQSSTANASGKVLVPGTDNEESSILAEKLEVPEIVTDNSQACQHKTLPPPPSPGQLSDIESSEMEDRITNEDHQNVDEQSSDSEPVRGEDSGSVQLLDGEVKAKAEDTSDTGYETISEESAKIRERGMPPPGIGQKIYEIDPLLSNHREHLDYRYGQYKKLREAIEKHEGGLEVFSRGYEKFGFTRSETGTTYREWAPGAKSATLIGDFNNWNPNADVMTRTHRDFYQNEFGVWEVFLPNNADGSPAIPHGSRVKVRMDTPSGIKDSIPAWIKFAVQAPGEIPYNGIYYDPPEEVLTHFSDYSVCVDITECY